jgi:serine/threonine protein kinase
MQAATTAGAAARIWCSADPRSGPRAFQLLRRLGGGPLTEVLLARNVSGDDLVVIKTAPVVLLADPGIQVMLRHEAQVLNAVQGPGVVQMLGADARSLVLEHLPGGDLLSLLGRPLSAWRRALAALAMTLERLHGQGLVHRDVRPENALFRTPSDPVWIDFQVALPRGAPARPWGPGTWAYASPEQREGLAADPRDDVYSFGLLLRHMLSLRQI